MRTSTWLSKWHRKIFEKSGFLSIPLLPAWAWAVVALISGIAALTHRIDWWLVFLLLLPALATLLAFLLFFVYLFQKFLEIPFLEKSTLLLLMIIWLSHLVQVFVPETGFDAVWYHLPVLKAFWNAGGIIHDDSLYQLLYPLWADMAFLPGFILAQDMGAKITAYGIGLALIGVSYAVSRQYVSRYYSLLVVVMVSVFQVVAWQSASAYVDVLIATWTLLAIWYLNQLLSRKTGLNTVTVLAATAIGLSIGSKHFNILLLIPFVLALRPFTNRWYLLGLGLKVVLIVALPWYIRSFLVTGQLLYPAFTHLQDLTQSSDQSSIHFFLNRCITLPLSFIKVSLVRDYLSPWLLLLIPSLVYLNVKRVWTRSLSLLVTFGMTNWLIWWFIPPFSTRYALTGFILGLILVMVAVEHFLQTRSDTYQRVFIGLWLTTAVILLLPRLWVNYRSLVYIFGQQTKQQFVEQFYDGNTDYVLKKWHMIDKSQK